MNILAATFPQADVLAALDHSVPFSAHWSVEDWQAEFSQPAARIWCAQEGDKLIGFIVLRGVAGQWELLNIAVAASYQHQGVATKLMRYALDAFTDAHITLEVSSANLAAQALYRKVGFVIFGIRKKFYKDGTDALIMGNVL